MPDSKNIIGGSEFQAALSLSLRLLGDFCELAALLFEETFDRAQDS